MSVIFHIDSLKIQFRGIRSKFSALEREIDKNCQRC